VRRIRRLPLSGQARASFKEYSKRIRRKRLPRTRKAAAKREWGNGRRSKAGREALATLIAMNGGRQRCMYCEYSEARYIDHFRPKADYPEDTFTWTNHLLACDICNSNYKRDQFPLDAGGAALLLNPTDPA
jgi:5-methylcytosine-specific restriction endonuclease McrA